MQFPGAEAESNTIVITGNENPVAKAKAELIELYEDEVRVCPHSHKAGSGVGAVGNADAQIVHFASSFLLGGGRASHLQVAQNSTLVLALKSAERDAILIEGRRETPKVHERT